MSDHRAEMNALTKENKQISVREIAVTVSVGYGSEFASVHNKCSGRSAYAALIITKNFLCGWDKKACELQSMH
jgi:hypothetical protein